MSAPERHGVTQSTLDTVAEQGCEFEQVLHRNVGFAVSFVLHPGHVGNGERDSGEGLLPTGFGMPELAAVDLTLITRDVDLRVGRSPVNKDHFEEIPWKLREDEREVPRLVERGHHDADRGKRLSNIRSVAASPSMGRT